MNVLIAAFLVSLFVISSSPVSVSGFLLDEPNLLWTYTLEGRTTDNGNFGQQQTARAIRKGNVVKTDGENLFVTTDDGSLHILDIYPENDIASDTNQTQSTPFFQLQQDVSTVAVYDPPQVYDHEGNVKSTKCNSGVALVETIEDVGRGRIKSRYLVYAVIDSPIVSDRRQVQENDEEIMDGEMEDEIEGTDGNTTDVATAINNETIVESTVEPTTGSSFAPSFAPTRTFGPSVSPTPAPSISPAPSEQPSHQPTTAPSSNPTYAPKSIITSRIIALNMDGSLRWIVPVDGKIAGTPQPGQNGSALYVSRNVVDDVDIQNNKGHLSVIRPTSPTSAELTASLTPPVPGNEGGPAQGNTLGFAPLGPPTVTSMMTVLGDSGNNNGNGQQPPIPSPQEDIVVVAESWGDGYTSRGRLYVVLPSDEFEEMGGRGDESYELKLLSSSWERSSVVAPLLQGPRMFLVGTGARIAGWPDDELIQILTNEDNDVGQGWATQLDQNSRNASQPFLSQPAISSDGFLIFLPGTTGELYCLESDRGREVWTNTQGSGVILSSPKVFESQDGDDVVYVIEALEGRVRQHGMDFGEQNWEFSCNDISSSSGVCYDAVEAEFSLSPSGNVLYYGDIFGRIVALQVADFETESPTASPSFSPTAAPSAMPSISPKPTSAPSESPSLVPTVTPTTSPTNPPVIATESPTSLTLVSQPGTIVDGLDALEEQPEDNEDGFQYLPAVIGAAAAGLVVMALAVLFISRTKSKKRGGDVNEEKLIIDNEPNDDLLEEGGTGTPQSVSTEISDDSADKDFGAGTTFYSSGRKKSKKKKKKRKNSFTPMSMNTLDCIEEIPDDASSKASTVVINEGEDGGDGTHLLAEISSEASFTDDDSETMLMDEGEVGTPKNGTHLELSIGNNKLKPLASRKRVDRDSWNIGSRGSHEEKKDDGEDNGAGAPGSHYMDSSNPSPSSLKALKGYGQSARSKRGSSKFQPSAEIPSLSMKEKLAPANQKPSFKRRSKSASDRAVDTSHEETPSEDEEEKVQAAVKNSQDVWSSFLADLADAEESFFQPSVAHNSTILAENTSIAGSSKASEDPNMSIVSDAETPDGELRSENKTLDMISSEVPDDEVQPENETLNISPEAPEDESSL